MTSDNRAAVAEFARIRLFIESDLTPSQRLSLGRDRTHYLKSVMRQRIGDEIRLFNGRDGEWAARIEGLERDGVVEVGQQTREQDKPADVTLAFAPLKKSPLEFLVEKATELGVARLQPVLTEYTQIARVNSARLHAQAIEAAEQSWRLSVPDIAAPLGLEAFLAGWSGRPILYCDERLAGGERAKAIETLGQASGRLGSWTILVGPEGGFSPSERRLIGAQAGALPISLGPRIVRAETAAVMALTLWQAVLGDLASVPN